MFRFLKKIFKKKDYSERTICDKCKKRRNLCTGNKVMLSYDKGVCKYGECDNELLCILKYDKRISKKKYGILIDMNKDYKGDYWSFCCSYYGMNGELYHCKWLHVKDDYKYKFVIESYKNIEDIK